MAIKLFDDMGAPRRGWLGLQTYVILVGRASNHQLLTYEELSDLLDHPTHFLGQNCLWPVAAWCEKHGLPPLTAIVVSKKDGKPGDGIPADPSRVVQTLMYPWHRIVPPTPKELDDACG